MGTFAEISVFGRAGKRLVDIVYPPLCMACRAIVAEPGNLCPACWGNISFIDAPACAVCGLPFDLDPGGETLCAACHARPPAFDAARSLMRYDDASKGTILALKWGDRLDLVPGYARWLGRGGRPLLDECDLIVPVPLHRGRLWRRRYNQAAELAHALARRKNILCDPLALVRVRATPSQGEMVSAKARRRNVRGAFAVPEKKREAVDGHSVLLIDDVFTTGATLDACAVALRRGGASRVTALTLARVVRGHEAVL